MALEDAHIRVHGSHIEWVQKNESFFWIKSDSQNILDVFICKISKLLKSSTIFMEVFFIISNLNDKRNVKCFLQVFTKDKRKHMA